jgi:hypothetical protein
VEGPDSSRSVDLGEQAVTLSSDADCALRLSDASGQVGGRYATVFAEKQLKWAVLEHGDEIVIAPHRLRFEHMPTSDR